MRKSNWIISPYRDENLKNIFELPPPSQTTPLVDLWPTNKNLVGPLGPGTWFNSLAGGGPEGGFGPLFAFASLFVARLSDSFGIGNHLSVFGYPLLAWRQNLRNTRSISGFAFVATSGVIPEDLGAFGIGFAFTFPSPFLLAHVSFCYHHFLSHFLHVIFGRRLPIRFDTQDSDFPLESCGFHFQPCQSSEDELGRSSPSCPNLPQSSWEPLVLVATLIGPRPRPRPPNCSRLVSLRAKACDMQWWERYPHMHLHSKKPQLLGVAVAAKHIFTIST